MKDILLYTIYRAAEFVSDMINYVFQYVMAKSINDMGMSVEDPYIGLLRHTLLSKCTEYRQPMLINMIEDPYVINKVQFAIIERVIFITPSLGTVTLNKSTLNFISKTRTNQ